MKLLLDGDIVAYQMSASVEQEIEWDTDRWTLNADIADAMDKVNFFIEGLTKKFNPDAIIFTFSDKENFRKDVLPTYKGNRKTRKPVCYKGLVNKLESLYVSYRFPRIEADDTMGILATRYPGEYTIVTIDKDLKQIPGQVYEWNKDILHDISQEEADKFFYIQCLTGDTTDNYPGLKGVGPVGAAKLLDSKGYSWDTIVSEYTKAGQTEEDALVQARCAKILRNEDWDETTQRPILYGTTK